VALPSPFIKTWRKQENEMKIMIVAQEIDQQED